MSAVAPDPVSRTAPASRWLILLFVLWTGLGILMGVALARGESLSNDLALPALAFFVCTALVGSQAYSRLVVK